MHVARTRFLCTGSIYTIIALLLLTLPSHASPCTVTDDTGHPVHLTHPAKRIITLAPDTTEILYAIGAGSNIVGTVTSSDYPPTAKKIKRIGSYSGLDIEAMLALKPDLIIAFGSQFERILQRFKQQQVAVYFSEPKSLQAVAATMQRLGCLTGHEQQAEQTAKQFLTRLDSLTKRYHNKTPKRVFFQVGAYSLITINKESWINQALALCGGQNIYRDAKTAVPVVSMESILTLNPEVIMSDANNDQWKQPWRAYKDIAAVANNKLISIPADWIDRAGPRLLDGVEMICALISFRIPPDETKNVSSGLLAT